MYRKFFAGAVFALAFPASALGQEAAKEWSFEGNVALTTDYVWRGISQTNEDFAVQGGFDASYGSFYAGTWASNVDFEDDTDTNLELDLYAGFSDSFSNGVTWDVGAIYYFYPDSSDSDLDFVEVYGGLEYGFEAGPTLGGYAYFDPDNENIYLEGTIGFDVNEFFSVDASVGNYSFDEGDDYTNYSLGATTSAQGFDFDLRFWGTDVDDVDIADDRVVLTVSRAM